MVTGCGVNMLLFIGYLRKLCKHYAAHACMVTFPPALSLTSYSCKVNIMVFVIVASA